MHDDPPEHALRQGRLRTRRRLGGRLIALDLTSVGVPLLAALFLDDHLATSVSGSFTFGMLVLTAGMLTLIVTALWYDHACRIHLDPAADEQPGAAPESGPDTWGRP